MKRFLNKENLILIVAFAIMFYVGFGVGGFIYYNEGASDMNRLHYESMEREQTLIKEIIQ